MRLVPSLVISLFALAGCRTATVQSGPSGTATTTPAPTPIPAGANELPTGTTLTAELQDTLSTKDSKVGDEVRATLTTPVQDTSGRTIVPAGAVVQGEVTGLTASPRVGEPAAIRVNFDRLEIGGAERPVSTEITETKPKLERDYGRAGKGAAIGAAGGAVAGAILGGGRGALVGGLLGAGAGTAISLGTGEEQAKLEAGTPLTLRLTSPAPVR